MKFNKCSLATFLIFLCLVGSAYAQRRPVTDAEMNAVIAKAAEARQKLNSYRLRESIVFYQFHGKDILTSVTEHLPPGRSHMVMERRRPSGLVKTETIVIDQVKYSRENGGAWSIGAPLNSTQTTGGSGSVVTRSFREEPKTEEKAQYLGPTKLGEIPAESYQVIRKTTNSDGVMFTVTKTEYWFDSQGMLLKKVQEARLMNSTKIFEILSEYDYKEDPTIRIEAPIPQARN